MDPLGYYRGMNACKKAVVPVEGLQGNTIASCSDLFTTYADALKKLAEGIKRLTRVSKYNQKLKNTSSVVHL